EGWNEPIAFMPDGKSAVTAGKLEQKDARGGLLLWEVPTGKPIRLIGPWGSPITFTGDGKHLLVYAGNVVHTNPTVHVWDVDTAKEVRRFPIDNLDLQRVAVFSGDGRRLFTSSLTSGGSRKI